MSIRKLVDINNPDEVDMQMERERMYQSFIMESARDGGMTRRERDKLVQKSRNRYKQLEQAYYDWLFADDRMKA